MNESLLFNITFASVCLVLFIVCILPLLKIENKAFKAKAVQLLDRALVGMSIIAIFATLLWELNFLQYKSPIKYQDHKTITLAEFRGFKRPFTTLDGEKKFAFVSTSIEIKAHNNIIEVQTLFHPCRSYVYNRQAYSNELLTHELYHLHITEYCARLMRKELANQVKDGQKINLNQLKNKILEEEQRLQEEYDDETYHSYVLGKQIEWQKKVDSFLVSLDNYSETIISLNQ